MAEAKAKKEAEKAYQKAQIERSIQYCRNELGLGRKQPKA